MFRIQHILEETGIKPSPIETLGTIFADIELINTEAIACARRYYIGEEEIKRMLVKIRVDTGTNLICINECIQEQLQFPIVEKRKAQLANRLIVEYDVVSCVELTFKNCRTICSAMILQGSAEPLLGCIL